jgi:hypothetical protein
VANGKFYPAALTKGMRRHAKSPLMHNQQYYPIKRHASSGPALTDFRPRNLCPTLENGREWQPVRLSQKTGPVFGIFSGPLDINLGGAISDKARKPLNNIKAARSPLAKTWATD